LWIVPIGADATKAKEQMGEIVGLEGSADRLLEISPYLRMRLTVTDGGIEEEWDVDLIADSIGRHLVKVEGSSARGLGVIDLLAMV